MLDPLSLAGLALAVFDELLKLGKTTAEVISDMRSFDEDILHTQKKIRFQIWRMDGLNLLFRQSPVQSPSPVYGDESLIQRFDTEAQHEIRNSLDELCTLLEQALRLLKRIAGPKAATQPNDQPNTPSCISTSVTSGFTRSTSTQATTLTLKASEPHLSSKRSTVQLLKWSFRDKKDISAIVGKFADVNDRLLEMIRFWSLASAIGVDLRHLEHLQKDEDAVMLGLHEDASLALALSDTGYAPRNFELDKCWDGVLRESGTMGDPFAVFQWNGRHILRENCLSLPIEAASIDPQTRNRINSLTQLLNQPKEELFCILRCEGWRVLPHSERITYLYEIPVGCKPEPESLLRLLNNANTANICPSLDVKFNLAYSLARSIAQLHMVKWASTQALKTIPFTDARPNFPQVHESFRSDNILFFAPESKDAKDVLPSDPPESVDLRQPWIFGFEFSRPESFFSAGFIDTCPDRDVYRHPERQGQPLTTFKKVHDIYSLGVVLLEIGIWRPAVTLERHRFAHAKDSQGRPCGITRHLIRHAQKHLVNPMGSKYRDIVLKCLTGNFGIVDDSKEDLKLQQAFRTQVVDVLRKIVENI